MGSVDQTGTVQEFLLCVQVLQGQAVCPQQFHATLLLSKTQSQSMQLVGWGGRGGGVKYLKHGCRLSVVEQIFAGMRFKFSTCNKYFCCMEIRYMPKVL